MIDQKFEGRLIDQKFEGRLMVLETIINTEIPIIKKYMEEGQKLRLDGAKFEGRLMVLESIINIEIPIIKKYMEDGQKLRLDGAKQLVEIASYVKECNVDREDLEKRTRSLEKKTNYQSGAAAVITFIITLVGSWKFWRG